MSATLLLDEELNLTCFFFFFFLSFFCLADSLTSTTSHSPSSSSSFSSSLLQLVSLICIQTSDPSICLSVYLLPAPENPITRQSTDHLIISNQAGALFVAVCVRFNKVQTSLLALDWFVSRPEDRGGIVCVCMCE